MIYYKRSLHLQTVFKKLGYLQAYIITHGHLDHIGALPHVYAECPAPIYATPWTYEMIKRQFKKHHLPIKHLNKIEAGQTAYCNPFSIRYVHVNHSIPDAAALYIKSSFARAFHTGDFKFDRTPPDGKSIDARELNKISRMGVDILLTDSTNASRPGFGASESSVIKPLENIISKAREITAISILFSGSLIIGNKFSKIINAKTSIFGFAAHIGETKQAINIVSLFFLSIPFLMAEWLLLLVTTSIFSKFSSNAYMVLVVLMLIFFMIPLSMTLFFQKKSDKQKYRSILKGTNTSSKLIIMTEWRLKQLVLCQPLSKFCIYLSLLVILLIGLFSYYRFNSLILFFLSFTAGTISSWGVANLIAEDLQSTWMERNLGVRFKTYIL